MSPSRRHTRITTPLGDLLLVASADAVVGAYFDGQKYPPETAWFGDDVTGTGDDVLTEGSRQLSEYFSGDRLTFDLPLAPVGTTFQQRVWQQLLLIEPGSTSTYGAIAAALSDDGELTPGLAQGVGQAVGHNPVSVVVPCHRVVRSDGSTGQYVGGPAAKSALLALEAA